MIHAVLISITVLADPGIWRKPEILLPAFGHCSHVLPWSVTVVVAEKLLHALNVADLLVNPGGKHMCALLDILAEQHMAPSVDRDAFHSTSLNASAAADASTCSCQFLRPWFLGRID